MFACFAQYKAQGWKFIDFAANERELEFFIDSAKSMMESNLLGDPVIGYDVHELTNKAASHAS